MSEYRRALLVDGYLRPGDLAMESKACWTPEKPKEPGIYRILCGFNYELQNAAKLYSDGAFCIIGFIDDRSMVMSEVLWDHRKIEFLPSPEDE